MSNTKLAKLEERKAQLEARIKQEKARVKAQEKRARDHRLILIGAEFESALGRAVEKSEMDNLKKFFKQQQEGGWLERALGK